MSNYTSRFIYTLVMVAILAAIVMLGQRALVLSIYAIQVKVFQVKLLKKGRLSFDSDLCFFRRYKGFTFLPARDNKTTLTGK